MSMPVAPRQVPEGNRSRVACAGVEEAHLRALVSPMHTVLASLFEVVGGWLRGADEGWVSSMLARADGVDLEAFAIFGAEERIVPDTLLPVPERSGSSFAAAVDAVCALPAQATRDELTEVFGRRVPSEPYRAWLRDPVGARARYLAALDAWWNSVIEPEWPRMLALLETEIMRVARVLATEGHGAALASVHPRVGYADGVLQLPSAEVVSYDSDLDQRTVILLPMACGPDGLLCGTDRPDRVTIAYAAPGTWSLFARDERPARDGLADMLSVGRAAVLRALDRQQSLRGIGMAAGLATSTVCEHLGNLERAELVERTRVGRSVFYMRTERGDRLVALF